MSLKYRTSAGTSASNFSDLVVKVGDTLPIGTEVNYDGQTAPAGWQEVDDPNTYSTTETKIGTWIDGKPIYRKVVSITVPTVTTQGTPVNATKSIANNIDNAFVEFGYIVFNSSNWTLPATLDEYYTNTYISSSKELVIRSALTVFNGATAYVSVKYTKTTD